MFCYAVFEGSNQIVVFPYDSVGDDWKRARTLAINVAVKAAENGCALTVEFFGAVDIGRVIWK